MIKEEYEGVAEIGLEVAASYAALNFTKMLAEQFEHKWKSLYGFAKNKLKSNDPYSLKDSAKKLEKIPLEYLLALKLLVINKGGKGEKTPAQTSEPSAKELSAQEKEDIVK